MKWMILSLSLFSLPALAVRTADCPLSLTVTYTNLQLDRSEEYVARETISGDIQDPYAAEEVAAIAHAFTYARQNPVVTRTFARTRAQSGYCRYEGPGMEQVKIYTTRGKNLLDFRTEVPNNPRGILLRIYATVTTLKPDGVVLEGVTAGLALAVPVP